MKNRSTILLYLLLILLISSCKNESDFQPDGKVVIAGKILNFEKHLELKNLNLYYHTLFEAQKIESIKVNKEGLFHISIPCHYKKDFFIGVGRTPVNLIGAPNDSLFLTIDADILNNPMDYYPNGSYFAKVVGGTRTIDNKFVNEYISRTGNNLSRVAYFNIIKTLPPFEYLDYQNKLEATRMFVLDSILQTVDAEIFKSWAKDQSKYKKLDLLLKYPSENAKQNHLNEDSVNIPKEYFDKIFEAGINETKIFSFYHNAFFFAYYAYLYKQAKKEESDILQYICRNATGFSKDISVAKYFYSLNQKSDTLLVIDYALIENEYLKKALKLEIEKQNIKKAELLNLKTNSTISETLFGKYKGKVVYVDFWATWCVPCMKEMPWSMKMQEKFKNQPVVFLFLCNQSKYQEWEKTIKEKQIKGEHVFLNDVEFNELKALFGITGVPHYMLINKQGGIINHAPRPSDKNTDLEIEKLLNE